MRIVILGGSGQIGRALFQSLPGLIPGAEIIGTSRNPALEDVSSSPYAKIIRFDPFKDSWKLLEKVDVLINCIGIIEEKEGLSFRKIHVDLSKLMVSNRELLGIPRLIQVSALGADRNHAASFLSTKAIADQLLLKEPITAVVRPSIVCTSNTMLVQKLRSLVEMSKFSFSKAFIPEGFLETRIQPVDPADLVEAIADLCKNDLEGIFEVAGPEALSFAQIWKWMEKAMVRKVPVYQVPEVILDPLVKYFISAWFPGLVNYEQYKLLFEDNVSEANSAAQLLGRQPASTQKFWINSFSKKKD